MLVFSRKTGQEIVIDGAISLKVLAVEGNKIRIGIEAPEDVPILRAELRDPAGQRPALQETRASISSC